MLLTTKVSGKTDIFCHTRLLNYHSNENIMESCFVFPIPRVLLYSTLCILLY